VSVKIQNRSIKNFSTIRDMAIIALTVPKSLKIGAKRFQKIPRSRMKDLLEHNISFAEFELDVEMRRLRRDGEPVTLNAKTFDLLAFLAENNGRIVSKDEILDAVWTGQFVEEANLSVQISALRKALGERKDAPRFLITVPGKGYKFVAELRSPAEIILENRMIERVTVTEQIGRTEGSSTNILPASRGSGRRAIFAGIGIVVLALFGIFGYRYFADRSRSDIRSLAVLPFSGQAGDANLEYLGDGLAESVIHSLSAIRDFRIMSRDSAFKYRGTDLDAKAIGRDLGVQAVLTGRILIVGDDLSVRTELVSTADNSVIWGEQFTRKMSDITRLQTDISGAISRNLHRKLSKTDEQRVNTPQTDDPEAYRLYLLGRYHLGRLTDDGFRKGVDHFQQAIARQPDYALAYAGLGESYHRLSRCNALSPHDGFPKARQASLKALELDPTLAEAHTNLAVVHFFYDWEWERSETEFQRAIELDPNKADSHQMYAYLLAAVGRLDHALSEMSQAHELDPLSVEKLAGIGEIHHLLRNDDQALEYFQRALDMDPTSGFVHWSIGRALLEKGAHDAAIASLERSVSLSGESPDEPVELARAYARTGKKDQARKIVDRMLQFKDRYVSPATIGAVYAALGESDRAFEWFERAFRERDPLLVLLKVEPMFDEVRSDPRFADLVRRVGLSQ
jgi:DNA-binding winged helix-turn-helix (wHTH) protein/TolB-like protein/Tfp pilus assembly protein PilF